MKRIFVSHANQDSHLANKLAGDLRNVGHDVAIDVGEITFGDDIINFMNDGLGLADVIFILYSCHSATAKWQQAEVNAATHMSISKSDKEVILLQIGQCEIPPLLMSKVFGSLDEQQYLATLSQLCEKLIPKKPATQIVNLALRENSGNPFWRVRAELFEDLPDALAIAFTAPSMDKIGSLYDPRSSFIEGSRGTGKSMLLMSLRARNVIAGRDSVINIAQVFGFYLRLTPGAFTNCGSENFSESKESIFTQAVILQANETFAQEFYLNLIESLVNEIRCCAHAQTISLSTIVERELVKEILDALELTQRADSVHTFSHLLEECARLHKSISSFARRRFIFGQQIDPPLTSLDLHQFKHLLAKVRYNLPELAKTRFTILLDEYENLFEHQRKVVNELIKFAPPEYSVKVAKKIGTGDTPATMSGQELQEIHDYSRISLVYSVSDDKEFASYCELLRKMVLRSLSSAGITVQEIENFLPQYSQPQFTANEIEEEVAHMCRSTWEGMDSEQKRKRTAYYKETAEYRLANTGGSRRKKQYAGLHDLALLSSGVVRYFQEIVGTAFYLQTQENSGSNVTTVFPEAQTRAVYLVSEHNLATISRNIAKYGESLKYFLIDIGDCLRVKLLKHTSEPEAGRLAISDPESMSLPQYKVVSEYLSIGEREGIFQTPGGRSGMRPKHLGDTQPIEFHISRIYAPVLGFSPRLRWVTPVSCADLCGLLDPLRRQTIQRQLIGRVSRSKLEKMSETAKLI
jgi:hypothetical protein